MNRADREKLYREQMGAEAAERQEKLADKCVGCGAGPGEHHSIACRYGKGRLRKAKGQGRGKARS